MEAELKSHVRSRLLLILFLVGNEVWPMLVPIPDSTSYTKRRVSDVRQMSSLQSACHLFVNKVHPAERSSRGLAHVPGPHRTRK
uniref:Putative secreted protein n=1 Tax=Anopheles marajoara TaxID=58244 RepID=A0A2M4CAX0_9DIPT